MWKVSKEQAEKTENAPRISSELFASLAALALTVAGYYHSIAEAQAQTPALPQISVPFAGDPRLEPIPGNPIFLVNFNVFTTSPGPNGILGDADDIVHTVTMRFPPRVNGQTASDGDGHADMYVLFDATTGLPINQPPIVEAVPNGATSPGATVPDLTARLFSAIWELSAVVVGPHTDPVTGITTNYDPNNPAIRIDSAIKVTGPGASPYVRKIIQTNIFLNCPIVPAGTTLDAVPGGPVPNSPQVREAFFEGQIVHFVPYDIEDGPSNPQVMFDFVDPNGNLLPSASSPHLVASRAPGDPFYSAIWEIWTVHVPSGFDVTTLKSKATINRSGFLITSSGIRLNCPAVAVDGVPFPFENAFAELANVTARARGFAGRRLGVDVARTTLTSARTNLITEVKFPTVAPETAPRSSFPVIDPAKKGNVIPLIFRDPFQLQSSGPTTTGDVIRINQPELDAAFALNPPRLPAAFEANFTRLINEGVLSPEWGVGGTHSYQERLALLGRAFFELVFKPEQGANSKDVTRCFACHSTSASGGAARALYTLEAGGFVDGRPDFGRVTNLNAGSMWGAGGAELLRNQLVAAGAAPCTIPGVNNPPGCTTFAHGSKGQIASQRGVAAGAFNAHLGVQSNEFIAGQPLAALQANCPASGFLSTDTFEQKVAKAVGCDFDRDGHANELSVGEVTAVTVFLLGLPVPRQIPAQPEALQLMHALGITFDSVGEGRRLFELSINGGGAACATCHIPFRPFLSGTVINLSNPETPSVLPIPVAHNRANLHEVTRGLASFVGEPGLRIFGDFKLHNMGSPMSCSGGPVLKTAELWDVGSVFPYMRCGQFGSSLNAAILAHGGVPLTTVGVTRGNQVNFLDPTTGQGMSRQTITITNHSLTAIVASSAQPVRVVLVDHLSPGIRAANADGTAPGGGLKQGAFWLVTDSTGSIAPGASETLDLVFQNPFQTPLLYGLEIMDNAGYSEAAASIRAYRHLVSVNPGNRTDLINFLRVQLIGGKVGEGSGGFAVP